jgi:RNA polymerase sigma factor (sigma-70 family)
MVTDRHTAIFEADRRRLAALAYRMTGSVAESEDILPEAWLRFSRQDLSAVASAPRWLSATLMRLCLDHLKTSRMRRERYVGAWLPDPLVQDGAPSPEEEWMLTEDVNIALILTLHRLSPEMRAAFILRDAFDYGFEDIARIIGRTPATCRQLVSRARRRLAGAEAPETARSDDAPRILSAFWRASREGDMQALLDLFAEEIEVHTDGGGKVLAAINILSGKRRAVGFFMGLARRSPSALPEPPFRTINGAPGFVTVEPGGILQTTALDILDGRIRAIWIVRNPEKLRHVSLTLSRPE